MDYPAPSTPPAFTSLTPGPMPTAKRRSCLPVTPLIPARRLLRLVRVADPASNDPESNPNWRKIAGIQATFIARRPIARALRANDVQESVVGSAAMAARSAGGRSIVLSVNPRI